MKQLNWRKYTFGELAAPAKASFVSGPFGSNISSKFFVESGVPVIRGNNLSKGDKKFIDDGFVFITADKAKQLKNCEAIEDDIVITAAGTLWQIGIIPKNTRFQKYIISNKQLRLRCDLNKVFPLYLYHYLKTPSVQELLIAQNRGSSIPLLTLGSLKWIPLLLPPIPIQKKIAGVLSAYDDLIEANLKRIKLLEEMAQITYEEWFVRLRFPNHETTPLNPETSLPEGWEKKSLSSLGTFMNGFAFKPDDLGVEGLPVIKIKEIKAGVVSDTPRNSGERVPTKYLVSAGDILFSWSASLAVVIWAYEVGLINQHLFKVIPDEGIPRAFLYLATKDSLKIFDSLTTGATMKHIKRKELDFVEVNLPDIDLLSQFGETVDRLIDGVLNLNRQNQLLKEARDLLLLRLMTGLIDIDDYLAGNGSAAVAA